MTLTATLAPGQPAAPPDHKQLPDKDGSIVTNFQEHPQGYLLTECLLPRLHEVYPDGQFLIGTDSGIYWRNTNPHLDGCKAPDWFLIPGVPPMLNGEIRRSYVMWQEGRRPLVVIEFVSGDGSEERDTTAETGKFWVYEQGIGATYYVIYDARESSVEVFCLTGGRYRPVAANAAGRIPIEPLGIELGLWEATYRGLHASWLRVWDSASGEMLVLAEERADTAESLLDETRELLSEETERAETERKRANVAEQHWDQEKNRADEAVLRAEEEKRQADEAKRQAEEEKRQADEARHQAALAIADRQKLLDKLRELGIDPGL